MIRLAQRSLAAATNRASMLPRFSSLHGRTRIPALVPSFLLALLVAFTIGAAPLTGCSGATTKTTTETVDRPSGSDPDKVERTVTVTEEESSRPGGIISGTVDAIGWVIALPFRIVGGIISIIF